MGDFAKLGRGTSVIRELQFEDNKLALQKQNQAINDLNMQKTRQDMQIKQDEINTKAAQQKQLHAPKSWEVFSTTLMGGGKGDVVDFLANIAKINNLVDENGITSDYKLAKLVTLTKEPHIKEQLSNTRTNFRYKEFQAAKKYAEENPTDENAQMALKNASRAYNAALGAHGSLVKYQKEWDDGVEKLTTPTQHKGQLIQDLTEKYAGEGKSPTEASKLAISDVEGIGAKDTTRGSKLNTLIEEYNNTPEGNEFKAIRKLAILNEAKREGISLKTHPDGTFALEVGGSGGDLQRKTKGTIEQKILGAKESLVRTENILSQFDAEFLTYKGKGKAMFLNIKDKLGEGLTPEEEEYQAKFSTFAQDAIENINLYIKEITGAQMSEREADRLRKAIPDIGDGIIAGDSPTRFKAKLNNVIRKSKLANARFVLLKQMGFEFPSGTKEEVEAELIKREVNFSDSKIEKEINDEANRIGEALQTQFKDKSVAEIKKIVKLKIKEKYGL